MCPSSRISSTLRGGCPPPNPTPITGLSSYSFPSSPSYLASVREPQCLLLSHLVFLVRVQVGTSIFWHNYRHVANVLSIYHVLWRLGIPDSACPRYLRKADPPSASHAQWQSRSPLHAAQARSS